MNIPALVLLFTSIIIGKAAESNWPQYRGRQASGLSEGTSVPLHWDVEKGENILWRTPIPGLAHSSPIIWNDRVYVATAVRPGKAELKVGLYGDIDSANDQDRHQWRLMAIDKENGKIVWEFPE